MNAIPSIPRAEVARRQAEVSRLIEAHKSPTDRAREAWMAERLPVVVDAIRQVDASLSLACACMDISPAMLDALRAQDDAELGRLVRRAVDQRLASVADLQVEEEAFTRYPEAI